MSARRALLASLIIAAVLGAGDRAAPHTGGSTGYATIAIDGRHIRYSLVLWPAAMPPAIADELGRARAGDAASRERLLAAVRDKISLVVGGLRCQAGPGSVHRRRRRRRASRSSSSSLAPAMCASSACATTSSTSSGPTITRSRRSSCRDARRSSPSRPTPGRLA